jgi:hypothetical protein
MSNPFDLNIENYNKKELEEIFGLDADYDSNIIANKSKNLIENIFQDRNIENDIKTKTIAFINSAKDILNDGKAENKFKKIINANIYNIDTHLEPSNTIAAGNTDIIEKQPTPYSQSLPSLYYPGVINPLKKRILTRNLNIDTRFRSNYNTTQSTNFNFDLPVKFSNILSMQLTSFEFPDTIFAISSQFGTNYFWLSAKSEDGTVFERAVVIVPDGNYQPQDLITTINNIIVGSTFSTYTLLNKLQFILNLSGTPAVNGTGKVTLTNTATTQFLFSLDLQANINGNPDFGVPLPLKLGWILGYRQALYKSSADYSSGSIKYLPITSEGITNTSGPNYIYLVIDDHNNNVNNGFFSAFNSSILNDNILARISLQSTFFNTLKQNNLALITNPRQYFGPVNIQKLNIQLLDEYGRVLNIHSMDYSFCLSFDIIYDL